MWIGCRRQVSSNLRTVTAIFASLFILHDFRVIDVGSEWRTFSNEKANADPSRVGAAENKLLDGADLSTIIGPPNGNASFDANGGAKYQNRRTVRTTMLWQDLWKIVKYLYCFYFQMRSSDRALLNTFKEITDMGDRINLTTSIVSRAKELFKQVHDGKNLKGRSNDAVASACLYIACRWSKIWSS